MWKFLIVAFGLFSFVFGYADRLLVSFTTSHLSKIEGAVSGVLITPTGQILKTEPMSPYDNCKLILEIQEVGTYQAYFEVVSLGALRLCPIVGGIGVFNLQHPEKPIPFSPKESCIQSFPPGKPIEVGSTSQPICSFELTEEDFAEEDLAFQE